MCFSYFLFHFSKNQKQKNKTKLKQNQIISSISNPNLLFTMETFAFAPQTVASETFEFEGADSPLSELLNNETMDFMEEDFAAVTPKVEMTCEDYLSSIALTPEQVFAAVMQDRANTLDVFDHVPITANSYGSHVAFFPNGEINPKFWTPDYFLWAATDLEMVKVQ